MDNFDCTTIDLEFKLNGSMAKGLMLKVLDFLLQNRSQIPFSFEVLKNIVNKKENSSSYKAINQLIKARMTYDSIMEVKQLIEKEFFNTKTFLIIFGSSITTAKEAYRIRFPTITKCYPPSFLNETAAMRKVLLQLIQKDSFKCLFSDPLSITNSFMLFERFDDEGLTDGLCKIKNFKLNKSCKKYAIKFNDCSDFEIFCEDFEELNLNEMRDSDEEQEIWYQSKVFIKGFNKFATGFN